VLTVSGEGTDGNCHCWVFVGWVWDVEATTHEGTGEGRMLHSKRDHSKQSALVASAVRTLTQLDRETLIWLDRWTPTNCVGGGLGSVSWWPHAAELRQLPCTRVCGCTPYLALLKLPVLAVLREQARTTPAAGPTSAEGPQYPCRAAQLCTARQEECRSCYGFLFC